MKAQMRVKLNQEVTKIRFKNNQEITLQSCNSIELPEDSSNVFLFVVDSYKDHYTGGRYHIWEYSLALAELGYQVIWLSNCYPIYLESFRDFKYLDNLIIVIQSSGSPSPFIFDKRYVFKNIVGTPLGCIECVAQYKLRHPQIKYYQVVLVVPPLAQQYRTGADVEWPSLGFDSLEGFMKVADYYWTQTNLNKQELAKWLDIDIKKIKVLPPVINTEVAKKYINNFKSDKVLFISRFVTYKHPEIALKVLADLHFRGEFIMIGGAGGLSYCQFEQMAKDMGVNLKIIESCSDDEKFKIISQCKLLLYPSDWEDFGMPPMEVGYFGIPTVAFRNPTYEEAFKDTIIYVKRGSYEDFKEKTKQALKSNELRLDAQLLVLANYQWKNAVINMQRALWKEPKPGEKITILFDIVQGCQDRGIGDVLLTTPIIRELKKKFNNCEIHYIAHKHNSQILIGNPDIDKVVTSTSDLLPEYTYHLTLERELEDYSIPRNREHRLDSLAKLYNLELEDKSLVLNLSHDEVEGVRSKYILDNRKKNIVIAFKSSSKYRNWPMTYFYELAKTLQYEYNVYLVDGKPEPYFDSLQMAKNLSGKLNVRELCCLIKCSDLVISLDSAALHIAGALDKKCIVLMGPIKNELRCSYYPNCHDVSEIRRNRCVVKEGNCFDLQSGEFRYKCLNKGICQVLLSITVDDVLKKIKKVI